MQRYYPGFLAALCLVLLRTAIGWHFLNEGMEKLYPPEGKPFTAEPYLRASTGPLAPRFRAMIPDVDSLSLFERDEHGLPAPLKAKWAADLNRTAKHYGFTAEQRNAAEADLKDASAKADTWFLSVENAQRVQKYKDDLRQVETIERDPRALEYQRKVAYKNRTEVEKERKELVQEIDAMSGALRDAWLKRLTPQQRESAAPMLADWTTLDWINLATKYGILAVGTGLLLGLFTRLSALGAVGYLAMFYLSMPPWPWLPEGPKVEGHYLYVNKNLIELLACLTLATLPTGRWIGFDSLLFGWADRRRQARRLAEAEGLDDPHGADPYSDPDEPRRRRNLTRREQ